MPAGSEANCNRKQKGGENFACQFAADALTHHGGEGAIGGRDERSCKADALRLVRIEQRCVRALLNYVGKLPAEIDGVSYAGVHTLSAGGTVYMAGISQQKRATHTETIGYAMMNAIGREPIQLRYLYADELFCAAANLVEVDVVAIGQFGRNKADETLHAAGANGKHEGEDVLAEADVQIAIEAAVDFDVGDVEELVVGSSGETYAEGLPYSTVSAVASADVFGVNLFGPAFA